MGTLISHRVANDGTANNVVAAIRDANADQLNLKNKSLSRADLKGCDLSFSDLSGADLSGANLSGAKLFKANLTGANLSGAILKEVELTGADLSDANLEDADLSGSGMGMAKINHARLFHANLSNTTLSGASLEGADLRCCRFQDARLRESCLRNADFTGSDLRGADLSLSAVSGASFVNVDLRDARLRMIRNFEQASWIGADIRDINFAGAYRMRRFIVDQNYLQEFRESSRMAAIIYQAWWLTSDCGRSFIRWSFCILMLVCFYAAVYEFVGIDYGAHQTWFSSIYFSIVTITTLGYGDVLPASLCGQILAVTEVITGYLMLGGLMSIFSNKMGRRAE